MKAKKITYGRLINKGNYENCRIEIEVEGDKGEKALDVYLAAKEWVERRILTEKITSDQIQRAENVLANKRSFTIGQVEEAEKLLKAMDKANEPNIF